MKKKIIRHGLLLNLTEMRFLGQWLTSIMRCDSRNADERLVASDIYHKYMKYLMNWHSNHIVK